jgi:hypothetical protein
VIVGVINVAKMIAAGATRRPAKIVGLMFDVPFFIVHYGMFCAVHGVLILVLFSGLPDRAVDDPRDLPLFLLHQIQLDTFFALSLVLLATLHLYRFVVDWLRAGRWRTTDPFVQMFVPYGRIIVVHIAVLVGGFIASFIGSAWVAVLLLALLKTVLEAGATQVASQGETGSGSNAALQQTP